LGDPGFEFQSGKRFFTSSESPDWFWDPHSILFSEYWTSLLGVKHLRHEADHSPLSNPKVENKWNHTSTPNTRLHGMERNNSFTLLLLLLIRMLFKTGKILNYYK